MCEWLVCLLVLSIWLSYKVYEYEKQRRVKINALQREAVIRGWAEYVADEPGEQPKFRWKERK